MAADLSHIETPSQVTGHMGQEQLDSALQGCNVVVIPAGVPRKPGENQNVMMKLPKHHSSLSTYHL